VRHRSAEDQLATAVLNSGISAVLICWEHSHIPPLASALPLLSSTVIYASVAEMDFTQARRTPAGRQARVGARDLHGRDGPAASVILGSVPARR